MKLFYYSSVTKATYLIIAAMGAVNSPDISSPMLGFVILMMISRGNYYALPTLPKYFNHVTDFRADPRPRSWVC